MFKIKKIQATLLAVAMMASIGSTVMAGGENVVPMEPDATNIGGIAPYAFTRHYSTPISKGGFHSVMADSNSVDDDDMIRIKLTGNNTGGNITYRVREYSPFGNSEQEATVSINSICEFQIKSGNNFSVFASTSSGSGTITTTVSLSAQ